MKDDRKRQKTTIRRPTDEVFVTQDSTIGRYYTEHESQSIKNKEMKRMIEN